MNPFVKDYFKSRRLLDFSNLNDEVTSGGVNLIGYINPNCGPLLFSLENSLFPNHAATVDFTYKVAAISGYANFNMRGYTGYFPITTEQYHI